MRPEVKVLLASDRQVAGEGARGSTGRVAAQRDAARRYPAGGVRDAATTASGHHVRFRHGPRLVRASQSVKTVQISARNERGTLKWKKLYFKLFSPFTHLVTVQNTEISTGNETL